MGLRQRRRSSSVSSEETLLAASGQKTDNKVHGVKYAKRKKPESGFTKFVMITACLVVLGLAYYTYNHFDHFHFNLVHFYARHMDDHHAQHELGHKILKDKTNKNLSVAFHWFRKSADKGHPHAAYNLAAGHLSGYKTDVEKGNDSMIMMNRMLLKGETKKLLEYAASNGVKEAQHLLDTLCKEKLKHCLH